MPPKTLFNRDSIIEAAFEIAKESGLSSITTRKVAKRLGSSVAPIYVNFETLNDLIEAVVAKVMTVSKEIVERQTAPRAFDRIGTASLEFSRTYPILFRELTMQPNPYMASYETLENVLLKAMAEDERMSDLHPDDHKKLLFKMRAFQIGLSVMISTDQMPTWLDEEETMKMLLETGDELLTGTRIKKVGGKA